MKNAKATIRLHGTDQRELWWHEESDSYAECCDNMQTHVFTPECVNVTKNEIHEQNFAERMKL
jgi:hypothetical protein